MSRISARLAFAALPLIAGCAVTDAIYSEYPLGDELPIARPEEWAGVWSDEGGILRRRFVTDAAKGMIARNSEPTVCDRGPTGAPVRLRQFGPWHFPRKTDGPDDGSLYKTESAFFRIGNALLTYRVDVPRVRDLVEKGVLPGRVEQGKVILGKLTLAHYKILLFPEQPLFRWQPSTVEMKLPANLDPCSKIAPEK